MFCTDEKRGSVIFWELLLFQTDCLKIMLIFPAVQQLGNSEAFSEIFP